MESRSVSVTFWLLLLAAAAPAQVRTSAITGAVLDPDGRAVAGARVRVTSLERGWTVEALSREDGYYRVERLDPGLYRVEAALPGFLPSEAAAVRLFVGAEARLVHHLALGGRSDTVSVSAKVVAASAGAATLSSLADQQRISELPLNGRDFMQLAALAPGVHAARAQARDGNTGFGQQYSISGSRPVQNSVWLDGVHLNGHTGGPPGSLLGVMLGVEAIREFSVTTSVATAGQGRTAGGATHAVSRSGSNEGHGSAYYFHRNSVLDARNFFDPARTAAFRRHQAGGSIGGPVRRDRTFYFFNAEGITELQTRTATNTTLSEDARAGRLKSGPVPVEAGAARFLALLPRPNHGSLGDTGLFTFPNPALGSERFITARLDHAAGPRDNLFARYTHDRGQAEDLTNFALAVRRNQSRMHSFAAEHSRAYTPALMGTMRAGWLREISLIGPTKAASAALDDAGLAFAPGAPGPGVVTLAGLSDFQGGSGSLDTDDAVFDSFQFYGDISWQHGRHLVRAGGDFEATRFHFNSATTPNGEYAFSTVADLLGARPLRYRANLPGSDGDRLFRQAIYAGYASDGIRLGPRLRLDLGLRYEAVTVPTEAAGKLSNLDRLTDPAPRTSGPWYRNPSRLNFAPRAGLSWDAAGDGRTVLRAGYGIYHDQLLSQYLLLAGMRNPPFYLYAEARNLPAGSFPSGGYSFLLARPTIDYRMERFDPAPGQPAVQQWNLSLERALGPEFVLRAAYAGAHGTHLSAIVEDANLVQPERLPDGRLYFPAGAPKLNPAFGIIRDRLFNGHAFYHALQVQVSRRGRRGQYQFSYTWSKSIDDDSSTFARTDAANSIGIPVDGIPSFNRGLSGFDVRQAISASAVAVLPAPRGAAGRVLGHWQVSGLASAGSGLPFSAVLGYDAARTGTSRPDYRGGQRPDVNPQFRGALITGDPGRWFDPGAFLRPQPGLLGNAGRNILTGPAWFSADAALARQIRWPRGDRVKAWLRLEGFNLTNHANFDLPGGRRSQVFSAAGVPEDVGRLTSAGPARKFQAGLRIAF